MLSADLLGNILRQLRKIYDDCELSCLYRSVFIIDLTSVRIYKIYIMYTMFKLTKDTLKPHDSNSIRLYSEISSTEENLSCQEISYLLEEANLTVFTRERHWTLS
jgi:hypothetical protein